MDGPTLMHQLLARPGPQSSEQTAAAITRRRSVGIAPSHAIRDLETAPRRYHDSLESLAKTLEPSSIRQSTPRATTNASLSSVIVSRKSANGVNVLSDLSWNALSFAATEVSSFKNTADQHHPPLGHPSFNRIGTFLSHFHLLGPLRTFVVEVVSFQEEKDSSMITTVEQFRNFQRRS